ncbi:IPT/TIG domain-containing protein [Carboxydocella sporoproducens DSM 16521]|uniref:IPT/TIG domain-containing protein n=2 Tax=Carboxydocella TaxID=178898 RepID=A0A1T4RF11_9FIRM|nr:MULTISPECIES: IPT/TIG domain-containing protein [Carboxydocella]AVX21724.1 IPT/TIG domain-containing protein [Carboxydocella thermautotrophica]AVX32135.1 IPT/TIG domain-containing protein [Carboxydocella thermautotrophica]SKA14620.1 IPT/TIG domain-containing protein [Carboxydocella sporoproducens DSM 16521]
MRKGWILLLMTALLLVIGSGTALAAAFTMPYVPQNEGLYDTTWEFLSRPDCEQCHGSNLADRHHSIDFVKIEGNCYRCHGFENGTIQPVPRECTTCHTESPHHKTVDAIEGRCTACHDPNVVSDFGSKPLPTYDASLITPAIADCRNCHATNASADLPKPIFKPGPVDDPSENSTHHYVANAGIDCAKCHFGNVSAPVRDCEQCHDIGTLHTIKGHTVDETGNMLVERCQGCHSNLIAEMAPPQPVAVPTIDSFDIYEGPILAKVTVTGTNFGEFIKGYSKVMFGNAEAPIDYWTDNQVVFTVPMVNSGKYNVRLVNMKGESPQYRVFTVWARPQINNIAPADVVYKAGGEVTITGKNFLVPAVDSVKLSYGATQIPVEFTVVDNNTIKFTVPTTLSPGSYSVRVSSPAGEASGAIGGTNILNVWGVPYLGSISPTTAKVGWTISAIGYNFGAQQGASQILVDGVPVPATFWSSTKIQFKVPAGLTVGYHKVKIKTFGGVTAEKTFKVY